jgi:hypothetical protein
VPYRLYVWLQIEGTTYPSTIAGPAFEERAEAVQALKTIREALRVPQPEVGRAWLSADWLCVDIAQVVAAYFIDEPGDPPEQDPPERRPVGSTAAPPI